MENETQKTEEKTGTPEARGYASTAIKIWLWAALVLAVAGACLLFPIGPTAANVCFLLVKIGMIAGVLMMLFKGSRTGFQIWVVCSVLAVIMTIMKWVGAGETTFLYVAAVLVDVLMPVAVGVQEARRQPKEN